MLGPLGGAAFVGGWERTSRDEAAANSDFAEASGTCRAAARAGSLLKSQLSSHQSRRPKDADSSVERRDRQTHVERGSRERETNPHDSELSLSHAVKDEIGAAQRFPHNMSTHDITNTLRLESNKEYVHSRRSISSKLLTLVTNHKLWAASRVSRL